MFEAAARTGSFRLAAEALLLTPSAISHAIRKLERELGTTLFDRDGRNVTLTPAGEVLMDHVQRGFADLWRGLEAVSPSQPGLLRLHAAPSFAAQWLAPRLPRFLARDSRVEVRLASGTDYRRFDSFDADIVYGVPHGRGVTAISLGDEWVAPLCTPALAAVIRTPDALAAQTLIESDNKRVRWSDWFTANGLAAPLPRGPRFDRSFLAIAAAVDGLGVALESLRLAEREIATGRLVRPLAGCTVDVAYAAHWLAYPTATRMSPALRSFTEWLLAELDLPPGAGTNN
jgi:LysR family transcriptional regulator, glycine cleavage system transcriptional activator